MLKKIGFKNKVSITFFTSMIVMLLIFSNSSAMLQKKSLDNQQNVVSLLDNAPDIEWDKIYNPVDEDYGDYPHDVIETRDGGYLIAGDRIAEAFLIKVDSRGAIEWEQSYEGGSGGIWVYTASFNKIFEVDDGYILGGQLQIPSGGFIDYCLWIVKVDLNGNLIWENIDYLAGGSTHFNSMDTTHDNGYILAGSCNPSPKVDVLAKFNSDGEKQWNKTVDVTGITGLEDFEGSAIRKTNDGGYILYGRSLEGQAWMINFNSEFEHQWYETYPYDDSGLHQDLVVNKQDEYMCSLGWGKIMKTDSAGEVLWDEEYDYPEVRYIRCIDIVENSGFETGYVMTGDIDDLVSTDTWVHKVDLDGNPKWIKYLGVRGDMEFGVSIKQTSDGGYIIAAQKYHPKKGPCVWLIKLEAEEGSDIYKPVKPSSDDSVGKAGETYTYETYVDHPENLDVQFGWDWNEGNGIEWDDDFVSSGEVVSASHAWPEVGGYIVRVKARDINGLESAWSDPLTVTMPRDKTVKNMLTDLLQSNMFLYRILQNFQLI